LFNVTVISASLVIYASGREGSFEHTLTKILFCSKYMVRCFWGCFFFHVIIWEWDYTCPILYHNRNTSV